MDNLRIEIIPSNKLDSKLKEGIREWLVSEFIEDDDNTIWSDVDWHILGWSDQELVGHLDVLNREVIVDGNRVQIAGFGGVITRDEWRGKGIASKLMGEAIQFLFREVNPDFGLLMCDRELVSFYQNLGWILVDNALEYSQPSRRIIFDDCVMTYPLKSLDFPPGKIDVQGCPW
ncbi:MAG TPA: GNAT family N-acetyltransferase [Chloroflexi bacterium]|nr:GNAT family N-acetyltransferase [Chloroflexota bacterium]